MGPSGEATVGVVLVIGGGDRDRERSPKSVAERDVIENVKMRSENLQRTHAKKRSRELANEWRRYRNESHREWRRNRKLAGTGAKNARAARTPTKTGRNRARERRQYKLWAPWWLLGFWRPYSLFSHKSKRNNSFQCASPWISVR